MPHIGKTRVIVAKYPTLPVLTENLSFFEIYCGESLLYKS